MRVQDYVTLGTAPQGVGLDSSRLVSIKQINTQTVGGSKTDHFQIRLSHAGERQM